MFRRTSFLILTVLGAGLAQAEDSYYEIPVRELLSVSNVRRLTDGQPKQVSSGFFL